MNIQFTYCKDFSSAETLTLDWPKLVSSLTHSLGFPNKDASKSRATFIGGVRADEHKGRADGNVVLRSMATIDFDALGVSPEEIEFALQMGLDCAFVAYSTVRHTPEKPRIRLVVPFSRMVGEREFKHETQRIIDAIGLGEPDKCSFVMSQLMFLPSHLEGVEPWSLSQDGEFWTLEESSHLSLDSGEDDGFAGDGLDGDGVYDLERALASQPLDMPPAEVDAVLERYPAEGKNYDEWAAVGMALYHQFEGKAEGYTRWSGWSEQSSKHDAREMRMKWRSFGGRKKPLTMATIIQRAGGRQAIGEVQPAGDTFAQLLEQAGSVRTQGEYMQVRDRVRALSDAQLPASMRAELVTELSTAFGKRVGMTRTDIKKDLKARRAAGAPSPGEASGPGDAGGAFSGPPWLSDWVYCEADASFERVSVRHSIKKEAFRMRYDREPEVVAAEMDAATYAGRVCHLPTVASLMYWPGAERLFTTQDGLLRLNTYVESGVKPSGPLRDDPDGRGVVELFLQHLQNTVADPREREIVLDFMSFVVQTPGQRVRWAILFRGIEGNGKSYFYNVMQLVLGARARVVSTTAINSEFTGWAEGALLVGVEEIRIAGTNKYAILDKMKPLISNDTISVIHKGRDERHIPNFTSYMMMTNHSDAIPVGDNDRRYCVISTRHTQKSELFAQHGGLDATQGYFTRLFDETNRRPDALARYLLDREMSADFSAAGRAPETRGLREMQSLHVSEDREMVEEAIERHTCEIINANLLDVTHLNMLVMLDGGELPRTRALAHVLMDMGYTQIEGRKVKISHTRRNHIVWYREGSMFGSQCAEGGNIEPQTSIIAPQTPRDIIVAFHRTPQDFVE